MIVRISALVIVAFWAVMWGLLIRTELQPRGSALREVPIEHVLKLLFHHQQASDLFIENERRRLGHVRMHPRRNEANGHYFFDFSGTVQFNVPGAEAAMRMSWDGGFDANPEWEMQHLRLGVTARDSASKVKGPPNRHELSFDPATRTATYQSRIGEQTIASHTFTTDEAGLKSLLAQLGGDLSMLPPMQQVSTTRPKIRAQVSTLEIQEERVDTYLVTIEHNGQTLVEMHISQLGQMLHAKTLIGWNLTLD